MSNFSLKLKNINLKLKQIKIYKKKKLFLKMKQSKISKNLLKNFSKNFFFFLVLIPKTFYFKIKQDFNLKLKEIKNLTTIQPLFFKKGFNNNILQYYLKENLYNFLKNKNKLVILYQINLSANKFIKFINDYYFYINSNFYILYSIYNKIKFSFFNYNYISTNFLTKFKEINNNLIILNSKIFSNLIKILIIIFKLFINMLINFIKNIINFFFNYAKKINFN